MDQAWEETSRAYRQFVLTSGQGRSANTAKTYCSNLLGFWRWCAKYEITPHDANTRLIREWLYEREHSTPPISAARRHNDVAALKLFFKMLRDDHYRDDDPTCDIQVKRQTLLPTEPLWPDEYQRMLKACRDERETLIIMMLAYSGLRVSELAHLQAENINWGRSEIRLVGKGGKERRVYPNPEVLGRLHAFCGMFATGSPFLRKNFGTPLTDQGIRLILNAVAKRAGVPNVHPHRLRAMFATQWMEKHGDIQALKTMMGHASIATTERYSEWTAENRGREMMQRLDFGSDAQL